MGLYIFETKKGNMIQMETKEMKITSLIVCDDEIKRAKFAISIGNEVKHIIEFKYNGRIAKIEMPEAIEKGLFPKKVVKITDTGICPICGTYCYGDCQSN